MGGGGKVEAKVEGGGGGNNFRYQLLKYQRTRSWRGRGGGPPLRPETGTWKDCEISKARVARHLGAGMSESNSSANNRLYLPAG